MFITEDTGLNPSKGVTMKNCFNCYYFRTKLKLIPVEGVLHPTDYKIDYASAVGECAFNRFPKKQVITRVLMQWWSELKKVKALQIAENCPDFINMEDEE